jgi:hypothetical protein
MRLTVPWVLHKRSGLANLLLARLRVIADFPRGLLLAARLELASLGGVGGRGEALVTARELALAVLPRGRGHPGGGVRPAAQESESVKRL